MAEAESTFDLPSLPDDAATDPLCTVERWRPEDREACLEIMRACVAAGQVPDGFEAEFVKGLEEPHQATLCCRCGDRLAACGTVGLARRFALSGEYLEARLSYGLVHPSHQGKGLGHVLLEMRLALLAEAPMRPKMVSMTSVEAVCAYHQRHGFVPVWIATPPEGAMVTMHLPLTDERFDEAKQFLAEAGVVCQLGEPPTPRLEATAVSFVLARVDPMWLVDLQGEIIDLSVTRRSVRWEAGRFAIWDVENGCELLRAETPWFGGLRRGRVAADGRALATWRLREHAGQKVSLRFYVRGLGRLKTCFNPAEGGFLELRLGEDEVIASLRQGAINKNVHWWDRRIPQELAHLLGAVCDHHAERLRRALAAD